LEGYGMRGAPDLADLHKDGKLRDDPKRGAIPISRAAKLEAEQTPRLLTVQEILQQSKDRALSKDRPHVCKTYIHELDDASGGMRRGHCWVFGADTNWGKSSFLIHVADENLGAGKRVLIVSVEDSEAIYGDRLLARRSRVNAKRLRDGKLWPEEVSSITDVVDRAEPLPVYLDGRGKSAETIAKQVDRIVKDHAIDIVLYDYLQSFTSSKKHQDERVKFREIAKTLTDVVKLNDRTGIIFSQVTVPPTKKYPDKNCIRDCRDVAHAAEAVLLGYTPLDDVKEKRTGKIKIPANTRCILVDKVKDGPKGFTIPLAWDGNSACFDRIDKPPDPVRQIADDLWDPDKDYE
jgi:replicative DNA helicase